jgi:hypothetical protein
MMTVDLVIAPFRATEGASMKRVTHFDFYTLGAFRSLGWIEAGHQVSSHRRTLVHAFLILNRFCDDPFNQQI